jgi:hypothetical protein
MCFVSIQKITSQTIRISIALVFLCIGVTICPIFNHFIVDYRFWTVNVWNRIFAKNAPKIPELIRKNMEVRVFSNET